MCISKLPTRALLGIVSLFVTVAMVSAQKPEASGPKVEIVDFGWSADKQLVVGVRVTAPKSRSLALGRDTDDPDGSVTLFTTKESWLIDVRTGQKIPASRKFPNQPNYGWVKTVATLAPGDSDNFTAAFPTPPLPPVTNGKREDFQLRLYLPGDLPAVEFKVPVPESLATAP